MREGIEWWRQSVYPRTRIPREELLQLLMTCPHVTLPKMSLKEIGVYFAICLEGRADITFDDWERYLIRFGPFHDCAMKTVECFYDRNQNGVAAWFHGVISRAEAEAALRHADDGAFLVRFSETQPKKFTLTYMKVYADPLYMGRRETKNVLIVHTPDATGKLQYGLQDGGNGQLFPSIASFIENSSARLRIPVVSRLSIENNATLRAIQASPTLFRPQVSNDYGDLSSGDLVPPPSTGPSVFAAPDYGTMPASCGVEARSMGPPAPSSSQEQAYNDYATLSEKHLGKQHESAHGGYGDFRTMTPAHPVMVDANRSAPAMGGAYGHFGTIPSADTPTNLDYGPMPSHAMSLPTADSYATLGPSSHVLGARLAHSTSSSSINSNDTYGHFGPGPVVVPPLAHSNSVHSNDGYGHFGATAFVPPTSAPLPQSDVYGHFGAMPAPPPSLPAWGSARFQDLKPIARHSSDSSLERSDAYGSFANLSLSHSTSEYGHVSTARHVDATEEALAQIESGMALYKQRQLDEAVQCFLRAEFFSKTAGEKTVEARALGNLGTVFLDKKQPRDAVKYYVKCLVLTRDIEDKKRERIILNNLVLACIAAGDTAAALQHSEELLVITNVAANRLKIESRIRTLRAELKSSTT
ncbi:Aste57867_23428 [Aphanomyces stellatus]|uniref:Aste57867_23428 protein n=1 Tax=Aphanomyces stellatus TaxID=120398 RepID=A0A485LMU0_9STRA|nr:hypothetical protein As57867_023357 [Aphanomyces stellatus]VFU00074.1 Aste57867_23428 [Aphanomyces stellatus]